MLSTAKISIFIIRLALLCSAAVMSSLLGIGYANAKSILDVQPLEGTVYRVIYRGSLEGNFDNNMLVSVGEDGLFMVDHRNTTDNSILPFIEREFGKRVKAATNTHWHPDHTNGNRWFDSDVVIIAHENTHARRSVTQSPSWAPNGLAPLPRNALPDYTFEDEISVHFNDNPIKLISLPVGHTDSDILVLFTGSKVAALGDVFNGRGQIAGYDYHSGDPRNYLAELDALLALLPNDYTLVSSHGGITTKDDIVEYRTLYADLLNELDHRRVAGMSAEAAAKMGLPQSWSNWLSQEEYEDSNDWLLEEARRLWADAETETLRHVP